MKKALFLIAASLLCAVVFKAYADTSYYVENPQTRVTTGNRYGEDNTGIRNRGFNTSGPADFSQGAGDDISTRSIDYYRSFGTQDTNFLYKLKTCTKAKNSGTKETVYGKTKNGKCHYSYRKLKEGEYVENHCIIPMQTAIGYSTTALDVIEYSEHYPDLAEERLQQNQEIGKIILDYCVAK